MNPKHFDVVIMGGGLAGLSLAIQLKRKHDIRILVLERNTFPVVEAAFKVGESTLEIAARYFAHHVGMRDHLEQDQLIKPGLRFYFSDGDNTRIERRAEIGHARTPKYRSYQLDRGRFENALATRARELGVEVLDGAKVGELTLGRAPDPVHRVQFERGGNTTAVTSAWVVDAAGRTGKIKRQLGLSLPVEHSAQATWFRVDAILDIDDWSHDAEWRGRAEKGIRRLATNHLMGRGYWVWLIPLASNSTSVGIVSDSKVHDFQRLNRLERAIDWLDIHEPQCAKVVRSCQDRVLDFRCMAQYALDCGQLFSENQWALVGEAGCFADPLYSPGSDFIAVGNCMTADLIGRHLRGEPLKATVEAFNFFYKNLFDGTMALYPGQYAGFGNGMVAGAKVAWDTYSYWGVSCLLFYQERLLDLDFLGRLQEPLQRLGDLNLTLQSLFKQWAEVEVRQPGARFTNQHELRTLYGWHCAMGESWTEDELVAMVEKNVVAIEQLAVAIFRKAARNFDGSLGKRPLSPRALHQLDPRRWDRAALFDERYATTATGDLAKEFEWLLRD
jgi:flavin-dependent dehydrogenase